MIGYYAIAPYFVCMALILAIASTPLFVWADTPPNPAGARISSIDGLRGFLALAVFFHHGTIYHNWLLQHVWQVPPSRFYTQLGQSGVAFFFMITGYLFWGKLLRLEGRINFRDLYIGRLFRIGPLYIFAIATMLGIVFFHTGLAPKIPVSQLLHELGLWLALGFFGGGPDVNGYSTPATILAGVTWSLKAEWRFYLSLLAMGYVARYRRLSICALILSLFFLLVSVSMHRLIIYVPYGYLMLGMLCASLEQDGMLLKAPDWVSSSALLLLLAMDFAFFGSAYQATPMLMMGFCFYLIVSGSKFFGLLVSRPAIRLGDISYGTYLLQGVVLYSIFSISALKSLAFTSPITYWAILLGCAILLVTVATLAHILIERPGIDFGKFLIGRFGGNAKRLRPSLGAQSR
jgi:peptidoglycan/LPS O-acetylase OafA/YrhL